MYSYIFKKWVRYVKDNERIIDVILEFLPTQDNMNKTIFFSK